MSIFEKVTAVAALVVFIASAVLVFALLVGAREAWRHRRCETARRRALGRLLHDYYWSTQETRS